MIARRLKETALIAALVAGSIGCSRIRSWFGSSEETPKTTRTSNVHQLGFIKSKTSNAFETLPGQVAMKISPSSVSVGVSANNRRGFGLADSPSYSVLGLSFRDANPSPEMVGIDPTGGVYNSYVGSSDPNQPWETSVPAYQKIQIQDLYPGINLVYYGTVNTVTYDLEVSPGANPGAIKFAIEGADALQIDGSGNLVAQIGDTFVTHTAPLIYQTDNAGNRIIVSGAFVLIGDTVSFSIGSYDPNLALVIDPTIDISHLFGSFSSDNIGDMVAVGDILYTVGTTLNPYIPGSDPGTFSGQSDVYISKIDMTSGVAVFTTLLGGSSGDTGLDIALDASGNIYASGTTTSTNLPTTSPDAGGPFQPAHAGGTMDGLLAKFDAQGALIYSTYIGGSGFDNVRDIAVDTDGTLYFVGTTPSKNLPVRNSPEDPACCRAANPTSSNSGYFGRLNASGSDLVYLTYLDGSYDSAAETVQLSPSGSLYVAGSAVAADFGQPTTTIGSCADNYKNAYVAKFIASSGSLVRLTCFGGNREESSEALAIKNTVGVDQVFLSGRTQSTDFQTTPGAIQTTNSGDYDAYLVRIDGNGQIAYSTYFGGDGLEIPMAIATNDTGVIAIGGRSNSTNLQLVDSVDAVGPACITFSCPPDGFIALLNERQNTPLFSTYLGGTALDEVRGLAFSASNALTVASITLNQASFPSDSDGHTIMSGNGFQDVILSRISGFNLSSPLTISIVGAPSTDVNETDEIQFRVSSAGGIGSHTFTSTELPGGATFSEVGPNEFEFFWTLFEDHGPGTYNLTFTVTDSTSASASQSVEIVVKEVNADPVVFQVSPQTIVEGGTVEIDIEANDDDLPENLVQFALQGPTYGASVDAASGAFYWTTTAGQGATNPYTFTVLVSDGVGGETLMTFEVMVIMPPAIASVPNQIGDELEPILLQVQASDGNLPAQTLNYFLTNKPSGMSINPTTGLIAWVPTEAQGPGNFSATVLVVNEAGASSSTSIQFNIGEVNSSPSFTVAPDLTVVEGGSVNTVFMAADTDIPANTLAYSLIGDSFGATIDPATGEITYSAAEGQAGVKTLTVHVIDGHGGEATDTFDLTILDSGNLPIISPIADHQVNELGQLSISVNATDADIPAQAISYSLISAPPGATINSQSGLFTWIPTEVQGPAMYPVTIRAADSAGGTAHDTFIVTVNEMNQAPTIAHIDDIITDTGKTIGFTAIGTDLDLMPNPQALTYSITNKPAAATFNTATGAFSWAIPLNQPAANVQMTVSVTDGTDSASTQMKISIAAANSVAVTNAQGQVVSYPTLQAALNAVTGTGYTLLVGPGTYNEQLEVKNKNGLTIHGVGTPTITGFDLTKSDNVTISGFHVVMTQPEKAGFLIKGASPTGITIEDNIISGSGMGVHGIYISKNADDIEIIDNIIVDNTNNGIFLDKKSTGRILIRGNTIRHNGHNGIRISDKFTVDIVDNDIRDNGWQSGTAGGRHGVFKEDQGGFDPTRVTLVNNTIVNNVDGDLKNPNLMLNAATPCQDSANLTTLNNEGPGVGEAVCGRPIRPTMTTISPVSMAEGELLTLNVNAQSPIGNAVTLTLACSLEPGGMCPAGVALSNGALLLSPEYTFINHSGTALPRTVVATLSADDGHGHTTIQNVTIVVSDTNRRPSLARPVLNRSFVVDQAATFTLLASDADSDLPAFSCVLGCPVDLVVSPVSGVVTWTPTAQQTGHNSAYFLVSDGRGGFDWQGVVLSVGGATPLVTLDTPSADALYGPSLGSILILAGDCSAIGQPVSISGYKSAVTICRAGGSWSAALNIASAVGFNGSLMFSASQTSTDGIPSIPVSRSIIYDSASPTVSLTTNATSVSAGEPITVNMTFSEPVVGFGGDSISVGGLLVSTSDFKQNFLPTSFSIVLTPAFSADIKFSILADAVRDLAGNPVEFASLSITGNSVISNSVPDEWLGSDTDIGLTIEPGSFIETGSPYYVNGSGKFSLKFSEPVYLAPHWMPIILTGAVVNSLDHDEPGLPSDTWDLEILSSQEGPGSMTIPAHYFGISCDVNWHLFPDSPCLRVDPINTSRPTFYSKPATIAYFVDLTPPKVISVTSVEGLYSASLQRHVTVVFSEPVQVPSGYGFNVSGNGSISGIVGSGNTYSFTLTANSAPSSVSIFLNEIRDRAGNELEQPYNNNYAFGFAAASGAVGSEGDETYTQSDFEHCLSDNQNTDAPALREQGSFYESISFLFGPEGVQAGVTVPINSSSASVLRGRTKSFDGSPIVGVTVSVLDHPEFGSTTTGVCGDFYLAVNGGVNYRVRFDKNGYMSSQRQVLAETLAFTWLEDVTLAQPNPATEVALAEITGVRPIYGSQISDINGTRRPVLVLAANTIATVMHLGVQVPHNTVSARITELSRGQHSAHAAPGDRLNESAHEFMVTLAVDEAGAGEKVTLSKPAYLYVENYLQFRVGAGLPAQTYEPLSGTWLGGPLGRVIGILDVMGGTAAVDVDGDGNADTGTKLSELGLEPAELQVLAGLYPAGQQLMRWPRVELGTAVLPGGQY